MRLASSPDSASDRVDIAVIGAGIVGIMTAAALQDEGRRVLRLDRGGIAEGSSYGNAAALAFSDVLPLASPGIMRRAPRWLLDPLGPLAIRPRYAHRIAPWLIGFWRASGRAGFERSLGAQAALMRLARDEMGRRIAAAGLEAMLRSDGCLELYESEAELAAALPNWERRAAEGIGFRHLDRAAVDELQPGLAPRFVRGTFVPDWQTVTDPHRFAAALGEKVFSRGGAFRRGDVRRIEAADGGARVLLADGSSVAARQAVVAAGAWSKGLARALGDRVPLDTERGYNTTLPPGSFDLRRQLVFGGHGFVVTPLETGIRVGGAVEFGGLDLAPNFKRSEAMLAKAKRFMPALATEGGRQWMGFRPSMPDSLPVIGRSRASPDVVYAFGHGHLGLTQSAATGRLVADLLARRAPAIDLGPFAPQRFRRGA
jgi:D-amino-acid dehydrogenase